MSEYAWAARRPRVAAVGRASRDVALGALAAASVGLLLGKDPFYALLVPAVLVAVWFVVRPRAAAIALGASIPAVEAVASGHLGLQIGVGDLLLLLLFFAAVGAAVLEQDGTTFAALRPVRMAVLQYCAFVLVLLFAHLSSQSLTQTFQRYELIAFPIVAGAYLALKGVHISLLKAYVVAATLLALVFPFDSLGLQKNPAGQFIANAVLLLIGVPRLSRFRLLVPLLVYGLFVTESRGALLACAVGVAILMGFRWMHSPRQALATGLAIVAIAGLAFELMPSRAQQFITTYQGTQPNSGASWNIRYRQAYWHDAIRITREHPWLGVGVGLYPNYSVSGAYFTADPHNVVLLQSAEGGWGFAASFIVLILGTAYALVRLGGVELAPVAVAVLLGTVVHGLVDVYWVRGTPVLSWLLTGMVCALAWQAREAARA